MVAARGHAESAVAETFDVTPEITVDNTLSSRLTVIEVAGLDRRGLLFDLTAILSQLDLNIFSAHIATFGEKAADVFYVTDLAGKKITDAAGRDAIRVALLRAFEARPARRLESVGLTRRAGL
jgi:[protein-PII] uridylyltransferase